MSDWRSKILTQTQAQPPRIVVQGPAGIGKSTLASQMPKPILIDYDKGADELRGVDRIPGPKTWADAMQLLRDIAANPGEFRSLVIDTVDPLEDLCEAFVIDRENAKVGVKKKESVGDFDYGTGYDSVDMEWRLLLQELDQVRAKGLTVVLLAHTIIRMARDPSIGEYDEYTAQLAKKPWASTMRWADLVGFANFEAARLDKEKRAVVTTNRILHTQRGTGFQAKNRYAMPPRIPFTWAEIQGAIARSQHSPEETLAQIQKLVTEIALPEVAAKAQGFVADAKGDVSKLLGIVDGLQAKLAEVRATSKAPLMAADMNAANPTRVMMIAAPPPAAPVPAAPVPVAVAAPTPAVPAPAVIAPPAVASAAPSPPAVPTAAEVILRIEKLTKRDGWGELQPKIETRARELVTAAKLDMLTLREIEKNLQTKWNQLHPA